MATPLPTVPLATILGALHDAASAKISGLKPASLAPLNAQAVSFIVNQVAPALRIPPSVVSIVSGESATIEQAVEPYEIAGLQFLQTRLYALLLHL